MGVAHRRLARPSWLRLPRRTARLRLTALYGGLFLLSGAALVAATYALFERATEYRKPSLPKVPHTPAIQHLQLSAPAGARPALQRPLPLGQAQQELANVQTRVRKASDSLGVYRVASRLAQIQQQLTQDQHQLTQAGNQLAQDQHSWHRRESAGTGGASAGTGRARRSRTARCRLAPAPGQLGNRARHRGRARPPRRLARRRQDAATDPDHHPHGPQDLVYQSPRAPGPRRPGGRAEGARRHPRRPVRTARRRVRGATSLRRQRLPRTAHPADRRAHPPAGCARRPRHDDRRMAFHRRGGARLERRAGATDRSPTHPRQQRERAERTRTRRPRRHRRGDPCRPPARDRPTGDPTSTR